MRKRVPHKRRKWLAPCGLALWALRAAFTILFMPQEARAQFPPVTILDEEDARAGITYSAGEQIRGAGRSLAPAGDVNRDGRPDLLVGAEGDALPGHVFLVLGRQGGSLRKNLP